MPGIGGRNSGGRGGGSGRPVAAGGQPALRYGELRRRPGVLPGRGVAEAKMGCPCHRPLPAKLCCAHEPVRVQLRTTVRVLVLANLASLDHWVSGRPVRGSIGGVHPPSQPSAFFQPGYIATLVPAQLPEGLKPLYSIGKPWGIHF